MNAVSTPAKPDNLALWNTLAKTDPRHTKTFKRSGGFSGTAIKPIWTIQRLTELFGPVGVGWGMGRPQFETVIATEGEVAVYCTVECWHGNPTNVFYGVGGDKAIGKNKYGLTVDDEAFKKAFTDAVGNAFKFLGVGADVHMGLFDDSKYVRDTEREFVASEAAGGSEGHSQNGAVSPQPAKGPQHSALKTQVRRFVHELNGCGDSDELTAFLATPDALKVVSEVREKLPDWWTGWPEQPDGFTPLSDLITKRQHECAEVTASYATV